MNAVLAGLDEPDGFDVCGCGGYVGTSAGSIVAAGLAAGVRPRDQLGRIPTKPIAMAPVRESVSAIRRLGEAAAELGSAAAAPLASLALSSTAVGGAAVRRAVLAHVRPGGRSLAELGLMVERMGARWDGRLLIVAVELESGRRTVMGAPGAPELSVSEAVQASCAIPGVFRPVPFGGHSYVDGGAWSPTNMDIAEVESGGRVLCLNPTASMRPTLREPVGALGALSRSLAAAESLSLKRRGASVVTINPDAGSARAMGRNLMDPAPRKHVIDAGLTQGRRLARSSSLAMISRG